MKKFKLIFISILSLWLLWVTLWAWVLPFNMAPDECLHLETAKFFQTEKRLPVAGSEEITFIERDSCMGATYISTPFLNYIVASVFINNKGLVNIERDYLAARFSSIFFGAIFVIFLYLFLSKFFAKNRLVAISSFISILLIPQVTYIFSYLNHEAYSLAASSFLLFVSLNFYNLSQEGIKKTRNFLFLGLAISLQLFTKSNFYLLLLIPLVILILKLWQTKKLYLKNLFILGGIIIILSGWFFVRNYFLYKDVMGIKIYQTTVRNNFGTRTYAQAGWNYYDVLFKSKWIEETVSSFYGRFGYMTVEIDPVMQWIFRSFIFLGIVGVIKKLSKIKNLKSSIKNNIWYFLFALLIPANIAISLYNTLYFDFQNQGRYLFPILIPLMVLVSRGIFALNDNKENQKTMLIAVIAGSILLSFWSFLYLPKI